MGRKKKEQRKSSSSEDDETDESSSSSSNGKEQALPKQRKKQIEKEKDREKMRETHQDRNMERSRWESPDRRKRKHSPSSGQNRSEERRRGQRVRQDGSEARTKWDKNDRERESEKESDKRRKEDRKREREVPERTGRNENNRENRPEERFEGRRQNERKSPRREERNRGFDERERRGRGGNDRGGRRGGRGNRFGNNDGPWNKFDDSRMKTEPSPEWGRGEMKKEEDGKPVDKEKPNFEPSGKLTEDANTVNGVVIKYTEPLEARKPKRRWRLYPFKGEKALPTLYVHRQSAYLMGRDRKVADIPLDHPSCSKQHAALQFRLVPFQREDGGEGKRIRPYLIDLESANGTSVNDVKLEARRYHELMERDVLRFGFSSREYVLLHEQSKDDALDDDVPPPAPAPVRKILREALRT